MTWLVSPYIQELILSLMKIYFGKISFYNDNINNKIVYLQFQTWSEDD